MNKKKYAIMLILLAIILIIIGLFYVKKENTADIMYSKIETKILEYEIKKEDIIETIATKYNIPYRELMLKNNIQNSNLKIGEKILIPNQTIVSINKPTTFEKLSLDFHIDEQKIKLANGISKKETKIEKGTKIIIPNRIIYIVKKNDTLEKISNKFNVTTYVIKKENNIKEEVKENDLIIIPNYDDIKNMVDDKFTYEDKDKFQTEKDQQNILNLVNVGLKMTKDGTYKNYKKENSKYYVTFGELKQLDSNVNTYVSNCLDSDIVIIFYQDHNLTNEPMAGVRYDCTLPF